MRTESPAAFKRNRRNSFARHRSDTSGSKARSYFKLKRKRKEKRNFTQRRNPNLLREFGDKLDIVVHSFHCFSQDYLKLVRLVIYTTKKFPLLPKKEILMRYHYASVALPCLESRLRVECCFIQGETRKTGHPNISAVIGDRKKKYIRWNLHDVEIHKSLHKS